MPAEYASAGQEAITEDLVIHVREKIDTTGHEDVVQELAVVYAERTKWDQETGMCLIQRKEIRMQQVTMSGAAAGITADTESFDVVEEHVVQQGPPSGSMVLHQQSVVGEVIGSVIATMPAERQAACYEKVDEILRTQIENIKGEAARKIRADEADAARKTQIAEEEAEDKKLKRQREEEEAEERKVKRQREEEEAEERKVKRQREEEGARQLKLVMVPQKVKMALQRARELEFVKMAVDADLREYGDPSVALAARLQTAEFAEWGKRAGLFGNEVSIKGRKESFWDVGEEYLQCYIGLLAEKTGDTCMLNLSKAKGSTALLTCLSHRREHLTRVFDEYMARANGNPDPVLPPTPAFPANPRRETTTTTSSDADSRSASSMSSAPQSGPVPGIPADQLPLLTLICEMPMIPRLQLENLNSIFQKASIFVQPLALASEILRPLCAYRAKDVKVLLGQTKSMPTDDAFVAAVFLVVMKFTVGGAGYTQKQPPMTCVYMEHMHQFFQVACVLTPLFRVRHTNYGRAAWLSIESLPMTRPPSNSAPVPVPVAVPNPISSIPGTHLATVQRLCAMTPRLTIEHVEEIFRYGRCILYFFPSEFLSNHIQLNRLEKAGRINIKKLFSSLQSNLSWNEDFLSGVVYVGQKLIGEDKVVSEGDAATDKKQHYVHSEHYVQLLRIACVLHTIFMLRKDASREAWESIVSQE